MISNTSNRFYSKEKFTTENLVIFFNWSKVEN